MINQIILILIAYFVGSLSFGIIVSYLFQLKDPRTVGSGNPGATNVMRSGNKFAALLTLLGDTLKATLIITIAKNLDISQLGLILISIAVLLGHIFPIYYSFKGGKGVATALGILLAIDQLLAISVLSVWLLVFLIWRYSSLAALAAALSAPFITFFMGFSNEILGLSMAITLLIFYRHGENINNLLRGKESGFKK